MRTRAAYFGIFTALALILGYVELLIPIHFGIPGAKLGLANLITILVLYKMGWKEAFLLSVARVVLGGFIFSNLFSILYSLAGGILSLIVMGILKNTGKFIFAVLFCPAPGRFFYVKWDAPCACGAYFGVRAESGAASFLIPSPHHPQPEPVRAAAEWAGHCAIFPLGEPDPAPACRRGCSAECARLPKGCL